MFYGRPHAVWELDLDEAATTFAWAFARLDRSHGIASDSLWPQMFADTLPAVREKKPVSIESLLGGA